MYTQCDHCRSILAIHAQALRSGRDKVRCGQCFQDFDALGALVDSLSELLKEGGAPRVQTQASRLGGEGDGDGVALVEQRLARPAGPLARTDNTVAPMEDDSAGSQQENGNQDANLSQGSEGDVSDAVPAVLRADLDAMATSRTRSRQWLAFGSGSLLLVSLLAGQVVWFFAQELDQRYPGVRPLLLAFCQYTGCEIAEPRDLSRIHMVSRDVRRHPKYEGALQVTASMVNTLPRRQPYPRLQFTLFNVNGRVIAARIFRPEEYLVAGVEIPEGMPSQQPVPIALDVMALEEVAVSFEFSFLEGG